MSAPGNGNSSSSGFFSARKKAEESKPPSSFLQAAAPQPVFVENPDTVEELKKTQARLKAMEDKFDALVAEVRRNTEQRAARRNSTMAMKSVTSSTKNEAIKPSSAVEETTSGSRQSDD